LLALPAFVADIDTETGRLYAGQRKEPEVNQEATQMHITGMLFLNFRYFCKDIPDFWVRIFFVHGRLCLYLKYGDAGCW